jgi:hypothetical protein
LAATGGGVRGGALKSVAGDKFVVDYGVEDDLFVLGALELFLHLKFGLDLGVLGDVVEVVKLIFA